MKKYFTKVVIEFTTGDTSFLGHINTGPYQYNAWLGHKMEDLDLTELQNIPHWMAKMQYVSSVRQASTANALPRLTKTYFVIASCVYLPREVMWDQGGAAYVSFDDAI
ncbi:MAG: hypothetical protein KGI05_07155 [Thaumarchaeota archaeon]|nr:hypothetical protein [Nitrososphaerota archaeon]